MKQSNSWPVSSICVMKVLAYVDSTVENKYMVVFWLFTPFCITEVTECQLLELYVYMIPPPQNISVKTLSAISWNMIAGMKSQGVFLENGECWLRWILVMCDRLLWICGIISMVLSGVVIFINLNCLHIPPTKSGNMYKLGSDCVNIPPSIKTISQTNHKNLPHITKLHFNQHASSSSQLVFGILQSLLFLNLLH